MSWFNNPWQQNNSDYTENNFWQNDAQKWALGQAEARKILSTSTESTIDFSDSVHTVFKTLLKNRLLFGLNRDRTTRSKFDKNYWTATGIDGLELVSGRKPSEGIDSILSNSDQSYTFECAGYCQLIVLAAMRLTYGQTKFDDYIKKVGNNTFKLLPYYSTGIKTLETYTGEIDGIFLKEKTYEERSNSGKNDEEISKPLEQLLRDAPIGSRILFRNFKISEILESRKDYPEAAKVAEEIIYSGWQLENSIKLGNDSFAAHGISNMYGRSVSSSEIRKTLFDIYRKKFNLSKNESEQQFIDKYIQIGQIETYKTEI